MGQALDAALRAAIGGRDRAVVLRDEGSGWTRDMLRARVDALHARLVEAGVRPDEPVHVRVGGEAADLAALMGAWRAGAVAVPVHRSTPAAVDAGLRARTGARWQVDPRGLASGDDCLARIAPDAPPARPLLRDAALVIFTSGSTGTPKGVVIGHDAFAGKLAQIDRMLGFGPDDRTLLVLNLGFSFGLWVSLLTLLRGGTLVMRARFDAAGFEPALRDEAITRVGVVPTMMRALDDAPRETRFPSALRDILIGGELLGTPLARRIEARFPGARLVDIYGLTETATCDFFAFPEDRARRPGTLGRMPPGEAFRIAGPDGRPVEPGTMGELQVRTPHAMRGYLDEPALTDAAFDDGWLRTGDLARSPDGETVELLGRGKELIARGGNKITPAEVERALCAHPDVLAAMVTGLPDDRLGERIHALLVPRAGTTIDAAGLAAFLRDRLERFKHPDFLYCRHELPVGRTGKADRGRLRAMIEAGDLPSFRLPTTTPAR